MMQQLMLNVALLFDLKREIIKLSVISNKEIFHMKWTNEKKYIFITIFFLFQMKVDAHIGK